MGLHRGIGEEDIDGVSVLRLLADPWKLSQNVKVRFFED